MSHVLPRIVSRERIFEGWNKLDVVTVEAEDAEGMRGRHRREVIDHGDAAAVLAVDRERGVAILVRQWRAGLLAAGDDPYLLEICAGMLDAGETPEAAARREAEEETGLRLGTVRAVGNILSSPGTLTERTHLFIADVSAGDLVAPGGGNPQEGEVIEVVQVPLPRLFEMARRGEINDAKTLILVQRLMLEPSANIPRQSAAETPEKVA